MHIVLFLVIILFPGYLLTRYLYEKIDAFLILPLSFALGLVLLFLFSAMPSYIFQLDLSISAVLIVFYSVVLFSLVFKKGTLFQGIEFKKDFTSLLLLILVIGSVIMMLWLKTGIGGNDALFHLPQIRNLVENSPVSPTEAVFPIDTVSPAYGYNVWYFAIAIVAAISKIDVVTVWTHLVFVLLPVSLLALFSFAVTFFKNRLAAVVAVITYLVFKGILANAAEFRVTSYPDQVARHMLLFVALLLFIQFINFRKWRDFVLTVTVAVTLAAVHLYSWAHFLIAVGAFTATGALFLPFEKIKSGLKVVGATLLISAPYLYLKLQDSAATFEANEGYALFNPLNRGAIFNITILILVYLALKYRKSLKEKPWLIFLASSALAGSLIVLTPFLIEMMSKIITFTYTKRLLNMVYYEFVLAAFITFEVLQRFDIKKKFIPAVKAISVIGLLTIIILIPIRASKFNSSVPVGVTKDLFQYIKTNLPERSVFAAGLWISSKIPVYTNNYIVMGIIGNTTWNVDKDRRLEDITKIFSAQTSAEDTMRLLDEYTVSYIVVSKPKRKRDLAEIDANKFVDKKQFREIYNAGGYKVYSYERL